MALEAARKLNYLVVSSALIAFASPVAGETRSGPVHDARTEVELVAKHDAVRPGQTTILGLRFEPDPGWHTYWQNPGGSGALLTIEWRLPEGFEHGRIHWPTPARHEYFGIINYGYERPFVLPVEITVPETLDAEHVRFVAALNWLSCKDICMPGSALLAIDLPVRDAEIGPHPKWAALFEQAYEQIPVEPVAEVHAFRDGNRPFLQFTSPEPESESDSGPIADVYFFHADHGLVDYGGEQRLASDGRRHTLALPLSNTRITAEDLPERLRGVLVFTEGDRSHSWHIDVPLADHPAKDALISSAEAARASTDRYAEDDRVTREGDG